MGDLRRIIARRSELDAFAEELAKQLQEVQAEREELLVAERVLNRLAEAETAVVVSPVPARVAGRAVLLIPPARALTRPRCPAITAKSWRSYGPRTARCRSGRWARNWDLRRRCAGSWNRCGRR